MNAIDIFHKMSTKDVEKVKRQDIVTLLEMIGQSLKEKTTLIVVGGVISVLLFSSREMTADIDVVGCKNGNVIEIINNINSFDFILNKNFINKSAMSISRYEPEENDIIFEHLNIKLVAGNWITQIVNKIRRSAKMDIEYVNHIITYLIDKKEYNRADLKNKLIKSLPDDQDKEYNVLFINEIESLKNF